MLKDRKSIEKAVAYQHTYRLSHVLPALLAKCHFENVYVCIRLYIRSTLCDDFFFIIGNAKDSQTLFSKRHNISYSRSYITVCSHSIT